jgi:hypothetical protein
MYKIAFLLESKINTGNVLLLFGNNNILLSTTVSLTTLIAKNQNKQEPFLNSRTLKIFFILAGGTVVTLATVMLHL